jgi:putative ABC transport system ATP-binding protein
MNHSPPESNPIVQLVDLKKYYYQGNETIRAVDGIDLIVEPGEFTALSGPSGSGKTTVLNLIGALDDPTDGKILIEGRDLAAMSRSEKSRFRRDRIGFVFQAYNLIPVLTAYENAEFILALQKVPASERRKTILKLMDDVGLKGLEDRRPHQMSGGQQQRIAIVRAIASDPAIILADEPTANVDSKTAGKILDLMEKLNRKHHATFLFSSHDAQVIARAHRVIHMHDGKILRDEIRKNHPQP